MGRWTDALANAKESNRASLKEGVQKHSTFFTAFAVVAILITGVGLADGNEYWWLSSVAITVGFILFFIFVNARVLVKASVALLVALFTANLALQAGVLLNPVSSVGLVWMSAQIFLFFFLAAVSYVVGGYRSRWTGISLALPLALLSGVTYVTFMAPIYAIGLTTVTGTVVFLGYYKLLGALASHRASMPVNSISEESLERIYGEAHNEGWEIRELRRTSALRRSEYVDFLVWRENYAFLLTPVELSSKFGISANKRASKLMHRGYSINNWLIGLINGRIPLWKSRNANIMLVLLDVKSMNGKTAEAIGVATPDSKRRIPVGIYPARGFFSGKAQGLLSGIEESYSDYLTPLTEKQRVALSEIGRSDQSEYLEAPAGSPAGA